MFKKVSVFFLFRTMLLLNYQYYGKGNFCVMLIERAAHPALESQVLRFFFRLVFFREMKIHFYCTNSQRELEFLMVYCLREILC